MLLVDMAARPFSLHAIPSPILAESRMQETIELHVHTNYPDGYVIKTFSSRCSIVDGWYVCTGIVRAGEGGRNRQALHVSVPPFEQRGVHWKRKYPRPVL